MVAERTKSCLSRPRSDCSMTPGPSSNFWPRHSWCWELTSQWEPYCGPLMGSPKSQGSGWGQLGHMALSKSLSPRIRKVPVLGCNDLPTCSQAPGQERPGCYLLPGPLSAPVDFQKGVGQSLGSQGNRDQWGLCGRCPSPLPQVCARPWSASWMVPARIPRQAMPCELGSKLGQGRASSWPTTRKGLWWQAQCSWKR